MSVGRRRWTWRSRSSTACWSWDARPTSASPEPRQGWGNCTRIPDPCTTAGRDVKPLVAVVAERDRALALGRPDAAQDRLQAEAVLVGRKHLDREVGTARGLFGNDFVEFFLNVDSSSGVAAFG